LRTPQGQRTPVHSHETWGVVGIYLGIEREVRYLKPVAPTAGAALTPAGEELWEAGQVTVCCTWVHKLVRVLNLIHFAGRSNLCSPRGRGVCRTRLPAR
jgi:predicted metal-dependent enzyme (double-stranded beta helix superfamily)